MKQPGPLALIIMAKAVGIAALAILLTSARAQNVEINVACTDGAPVPGALAIVDSLRGDLLVPLVFYTDEAGQIRFDSAFSGLSSSADYVAQLFLPLGLEPVDPVNGVCEFRVFSDADTICSFLVTGCEAAPPSASVGDRVWMDVDCNGIQDDGEPGVEGIEVQLMDCGGTLMAMAQTDANGEYLFTQLSPGDYSVRFIAPAGRRFSPPDQGTDAGLDSDADPVTGMTYCLSLGPGEVDRNWDAGLCEIDSPRTGSLGYWKNHPEAWPTASVEAGGRVYTQTEAVQLMRAPIRNNKWLNLYRQLVVAKLNVAIGNESSCVAEIIAETDAWLAATFPGPVPAKSKSWKASGSQLHAVLNRYNNGMLCGPHRD